MAANPAAANPAAAKVPKVKLNNGWEMPMIGLGTYEFHPTDEVTQAVRDAIDVGYRHFDCAFVYENEAEVGKALTDKMASGDVKREELFITSKLWNTFHHPKSVEKALKKSLRLLGLHYLDLYLIHSPISLFNCKQGELHPKDDQGNMIFKSVHHVDTWRAMENCVDKGLTRSIGLSNFNSQQLQCVFANSKIKPVIHQIESHPYLNQRRMIEFCKERDIHVTAHTPLGSPGRIQYKMYEPKLMEDQTIREIAEKYKKTPAQILIRYQIERGVSVIPKSFNKTRMGQNLDIFDIKIDDEDMRCLNSLDRNVRICDFIESINSLDYPFSQEF